jgi:hypothetical protein
MATELLLHRHIGHDRQCPAKIGYVALRAVGG